MTMTSDDLTLDLLASPAAAGLARSLITHRLTKWRLPHLLDDALLISSELITNSAEATPGLLIKFRLARTPAHLHISTWDSSPLTPTLRPTVRTLESLDSTPETFDTGGGWGLHLVTALSTTHGTTPTPHGKWTWATLTP
ncbi:hypothetical protein GCM10027589_19640 [Actinocorallia lasiicapitis]